MSDYTKDIIEGLKDLYTLDELVCEVGLDIDDLLDTTLADYIAEHPKKFMTALNRLSPPYYMEDDDGE